MHDGQFRQSGEPYFSHPIAVAAILTEQRLDDATIITALLHDTIEDTKASFREVEERFGREVAELVDGVTKLTNLQLSSHETKQAENFRKLFMAMSKDLRVILVKLADRLHNMRTIKSMRQEKQVQKARETMDIYAPLAGRMGMQWMREELEDLSFRVLNPRDASRYPPFLSPCSARPATSIHRIHRRHAERALAVQVWADRFLVGPKKLIRSGERCRRKSSGFSVCPISTDSVSSRRAKKDCYRTLGAIISVWRAVRGVSRTTSPAGNPMVPDGSIPRWFGRAGAPSRFRSGPVRCTDVV
ncbi:UNVERIFIED_CONTAM: hypothetical protein GTU68_017780 [Idotea baltica]|nr:hypothetical protein [Idotea baltica]